jgi:hypothetical protein
MVVVRVILFQLSVKYRRNNSVDDVTVEVAFAIIFFNSLEYTDEISSSVILSIIIKKIYLKKFY